MSEPPLFERLPEQYFTASSAAAAAARAGRPAAAPHRPRPRQPGPAAAGARDRGAAGGGAGDATPPSTATRRSRPARPARGDRRALPADHGVALDPEREVAVVPARRPGSCSPRWPRRARRHRPAARPRLPRLSVGCGARGARARRCRSTQAPAGSPTSTPSRRAAGRGAAQLPLEPVRRVRARRDVRARGGLARERGAGWCTTSPTASWPSTGAARAACWRSTGARDVARRAVVAVEDLRDGRLARGLRRRRRRAGRADPDAARPPRRRRVHGGAARARRRRCAATRPTSPRAARSTARGRDLLVGGCAGGRRHRPARGHVLRLVAAARRPHRRARCSPRTAWRVAPARASARAARAGRGCRSRSPTPTSRRPRSGSRRPSPAPARRRDLVQASQLRRGPSTTDDARVPTPDRS